MGSTLLCLTLRWTNLKKKFARDKHSSLFDPTVVGDDEKRFYNNCVRLDACCLHFAIKGKAKTETYTFQTRDPNVKKEWIVGKKKILFYYRDDQT